MSDAGPFWSLGWSREPWRVNGGEVWEPLGEVSPGILQTHTARAPGCRYEGCMCSVVSDSLRPHGLLAPQDPQSVGFSRQESWNGFPLPPPGDLPDPRIEPRSPALQADSLPAEPQRKPKNPGVGCHFLLQRLFPTQGSSPHLLHWQADSLPSKPPGKTHRFGMQSAGWMNIFPAPCPSSASKCPGSGCRESAHTRTLCDPSEVSLPSERPSYRVSGPTVSLINCRS